MRVPFIIVPVYLFQSINILVIAVDKISKIYISMFIDAQSVQLGIRKAYKFPKETFIIFNRKFSMKTNPWLIGKLKFK